MLGWWTRGVDVWTRWVVSLLSLLAILVACGMGWLSQNYRGLTRGLIHQVGYGTLHESWNLYQSVSYWVEFMQKLSFNDGSQTYELPRLYQRHNAYELGRMAFHRGDVEESVFYLERAADYGRPSEEKLFWLAMAHLRQAESINCLDRLSSDGEARGEQVAHAHSRHHPTLCSLPLPKAHERREYATRAAALFEELLRHYDRESRLYQWLLTFTSITAGTLPDSMPERYRIRSPFMDTFYGTTARKAKDRYAGLVFEDRAAALNVATYDTGRGVAVEDFDGDGDLDLVTGGTFDTVRYYSNEAGMTFRDRTAEVGLEDVTQPFIITAADYDNDGWVDLLVARPFDYLQLFRNTGGGRFKDETSVSGLLRHRKPGHIAATWVSAWGDVDNDGDLDLFLAQWALRLPFSKGLLAHPRMDSVLFLNEAGTFTDASQTFGLAHELHDSFFVGASFGDYDNDGYSDLYLSSPLPKTSALFRNHAGEYFAKVGPMEGQGPGFVTAMLDVNHDGRLDIFKGGSADARSSTEYAVFGDRRIRSGRSTILLQGSDGGFQERGDLFEAQMPMGTMGASYGDLNNDGCVDFYLGTGSPEPWFVLPNLMYLGQAEGSTCTGRTTNVSMLHGFGTVQKGHGVVFFDYDNDGDQDVYSSLGGMWPGDRWPNQFFINKSTLKNSWVKIRLRGRRTNHFGVGAKIRVVALGPDGGEIVRTYHMDNKTGFGSAPYLAHIGLLDAVEISGIEVHWPVSGCRGFYRGELNSLLLLDESDCSHRVRHNS